MAKQLTALGADVFAGLFTYGIKKAGYKVLGQLEHGNYGNKTMQLNHPEIDVRIGAENWNPLDFQDRVDFMYTNPPCAAWSTAGRNTQGNITTPPWFEQHERLNYVRDLVDAGIVIRPRAWCWESVTGAWGRGREFVVEQARIWNQAGYHATVLIQNNMYIGGRQDRKRIFLIAHKHPIIWQPFTQPTTVKDIVAQVKRDVKALKLGKPPLESPPLNKLNSELWKRAGENRGYLRRVYQLMEKTETDGLGGPIPLHLARRLSADDPPPVMIDGANRLHPTESRGFNYYEWLAFAGLPYDWETGCGSFNAFTKELSRAVMPGVGEWLGRSIAAGLARKPLQTDIVTFELIDLRKPFDPYFKLESEVLESHRPDPDQVQASVGQIFAPRTTPAKPPRIHMPRDPNVVRADRPPRLGSGHRIREMLLQGMGTNEILKIIHNEFPQSKATASDVSWNKGKLRKMEQQNAA